VFGAKQQPATVETFPVSFCVITCDADAPHFNAMMATLPPNAEVCILHNQRGEAEDLSEMEVTQHGNRTVRLRRWTYVGDFHFAQARNLCDEMATNDWCMWVDTDDRLNACQHEVIRRFAIECPAGYGGAWGGVASYESSFDGGRGKVTGAYQLRFYRKSVGAKWEGRVHEQIHPAIQAKGYQTADTSVMVLHMGYMGTPEQKVAKLRRNFDLLTKQVSEGASTPFLRSFFVDALQDTSAALVQLRNHKG
jgi:hypothetical protein